MTNQMQEFDNLLREKLEAIIFPSEQIKSMFIKKIDVLLANSSLSNLKCDVRSYERLLDSTVEKNVYDISFFINRYFELSPATLGITPVVYLEFLKEINQMSTYWNSIVAPIQKNLQVHFNNKLVAEAKKNGNKPILHTPQLVK